MNIKTANNQPDNYLPDTSYLLPSFLKILSDPDIKNIMLVGCGGGFDFVHSMTLYPELIRMGKKVIIGSYSFGDPRKLDNSKVIFNEKGALVKQVTDKSVPDPYYAPEVHLCNFLDSRYPEQSPHSIYAYYARSFTIGLLTKFYQQLVNTHAIDAVVLFDGGSDSLMKGDEHGLGDPIEDAVSVGAVASLTGLKTKILISIGVGTDRFNDVSDASTLRAIAELTQMGGFLGSVSLEPTNPGFLFYRESLDAIYKGHGPRGFRSVLSGAIVSATEGWFGSDKIPPNLQSRVRKGQLYLWPLMAMLWAFDLNAVAKRSLIVDWLKDCKTPGEGMMALINGRYQENITPREIEELPQHCHFRLKQR